MQRPIVKALLLMRQHFAAGLLLLSLAASSWADLDTFIIDQGVDDPIRIAVVPFALSKDLDNADNLAKLIVVVFFQVNAVKSVHESMENFVWLGRSKHKRVSTEIKIHNVIINGKFVAVILVGVEDRE